jgi:mono/diheme cytochrome c family protein
MARLAIVALLTTSACSLYYGDGKSGTTADASAQSPAEQDFTNKVLPILEANCGACHATGAGGAQDFLAGSSPVEILYNLESSQPPLIDMGDPSASLLLHMGPHEGPALDNTAQAVIVEWLNQY